MDPDGIDISETEVPGTVYFVDSKSPRVMAEYNSMLTAIYTVNHSKAELAEASTNNDIVLLPRPLNTARDPLVCQT